MSSDLLNIILALTSIVTTIILIITLVIMVRQTKQTTIISYHQYYKDVESLLFQNPTEAEFLLGQNKEFAIASIILGTLELAFKLYKGHLTDRRWWESDDAIVEYILKQERMRAHWKRSKAFYNQNFVEFIDKKLEKLDQKKQDAPQTITSSVSELPK